MKLTTCYIAGVPAALLAMAYLVQVASRPSPDTPADLSFYEDAEKTAELDRQLQAITTRQEAKAEIARAVMRCELSLLEAAARIRELVASDPRYLAVNRIARPDYSDDEIFCRQVIASVAVLAEDMQCEINCTVARLEAEFETHRRGGTLVLPEPPAHPPTKIAWALVDHLP
jgi:hypothetical protein